MANVLDRNFDFLTNGTVTAAGLHNLIDETNIYAGLISTQEAKTTVGTGDLLLIADSSSIGSPQVAANRVTVQKLFSDTLTNGTFTGLGLNLTNATITNGTVTTLNSTTGTITNLSTTLAGDLTISQGTATLGTSGATAATYGTTNAIPRITVDAKGRVTAASTVTAPVGFRNRIINGDMRIDQRNGGASVTANNAVFPTDRFYTSVSQTSKANAQQNAGSVTPPTGFTNYLGITSTSAYSVVASDFFTIRHTIEGFNASDLMWGTASAQTVTISFWIRSSLTGTFGGSLYNSAANRCYPFSYTISSANTWEQKSVTISGDTTGTWLTDNSAGVTVQWSYGAGSTFSGTAGSWGSTYYASVTGAVSVVGTNGATFYITGVQFEAGSTATEFERRPIGTELALCQRYCQVAGGGASGQWWDSTSPEMAITFAVPFRSAPTSAMFTTSVSVSEIATATRTSTTAAIQGGTLTINGGNLRINGFTGATQFRGALCLTNCFLLTAEL
jgi:hypothetical protein